MDSKGSFRFEEGVPPTGVAEENTGKKIREETKFKREIMILTEKTMIYSLITEPRLMEFNIHLLQSKIKQPGKENKSKSKQISHRVT